MSADLESVGVRMEGWYLTRTRRAMVERGVGRGGREGEDVREKERKVERE